MESDQSTTEVHGTKDQQESLEASKPLSFDEVVALRKQKDTTKGKRRNYSRFARYYPLIRFYCCVVIVRFRAIGNAPILKQSFYKITASNKFQTVIQFLRKELKYQGTDPLVKTAKPSMSLRPY